MHKRQINWKKGHSNFVLYYSFNFLSAWRPRSQIRGTVRLNVGAGGGQGEEELYTILTKGNKLCRSGNVAEKIIRPVRNQVTIREVGEHFTPVNPEDLTLEILGPGSEVIGLFIGKCSRSGSKGPADCW